ncbi:serine/threonine-protein kinase [Nocardia sp. CWNU-33]|uniref:serine/threonine-protein kinase n=1 Tax=Nocardia sp. CWNU-33 TaxID=3392117 RepID=UPI00398F4739
MQELTSGQVFAGYIVQRRLGAGGMGSVYLARHPRLPRLDALKLLDRSWTGDDDIRARFLCEADHVARLQHPNIVTVYDRGREDDQLWISMEYIDGDDAATVLRAHGALSAGRAVRILSEVAKGLDFAHESGVLHRDVKPANILLGRPPRDQDESVVLTDFGIAKVLEDTQGLTRTGILLVSFPYAAPEQFDPEADLDARADVYSLGCTFYHLLTGSPPYAGTTPQQFMHGHLYVPIPRPSRVPAAREAGLSPAFDEVIEYALAKDRGDRPPSCRALAAAAQRALASVSPIQPVPAMQPPTQRSRSGQSSRAFTAAPHEVISQRAQAISTPVHIPRPRRSMLVILSAIIAACAVVAGVTVAGIKVFDVVNGGETTAADPSADVLPGGYAGTWAGSISDPVGLSFDVLLTLRAGRVGEEVGTLSQTAKFGSKDGCESRVLLKSVSSTGVTFQERLSGNAGKCVETGATTTLELVADGSLGFRMSGIGLGEITGTLHRQ